MKVYINKIKVKESEIDELNHVNNVVYLQWVNDVSALHWRILSNDKINSKYIWVAVRHEIDYIKPAFLNENISIKTWIATLKGVKSIRKVEIYRKEELLAKSETTWVLLDAKTQKITRIPKEIEEIFNN
jgi:acyl-CoA thioester hydrolase